MIAKDNLVFGLSGIIVGLILGVLLSRHSSPPPGNSSAPVSQASQGTGQPELPDGHPPVDIALIEKQIELHQALLAKDPDNQQALVTVANLNFDMKNYPEAIAHYERALQQDQDNINLITDLGTSYFYSNNKTKALELYDRALAIDPRHFQTLLNVGVVKMSSGDETGAAEAWEKLVAFYPDSPESRELKGMLAQLRKGNS